MNFVGIIGMAAGLLTTISFLPQAIKIIKTKDTSGISLIMYIVFTAGVFLWVLYGIYLRQMPIIIANVITLILAGTILLLKIKGDVYDKKRKI